MMIRQILPKVDVKIEWHLGTLDPEVEFQLHCL